MIIRLSFDHLPIILRLFLYSWGVKSSNGSIFCPEGCKYTADTEIARKEMLQSG
jgi:hypothetical protein